MLTPRHRFRQLDPSWFLNGQTTSLLASDAEKAVVNEFLGGMPGGGWLGLATGCLQGISRAARMRWRLYIEYVMYWIKVQDFKDQLAERTDVKISDRSCNEGVTWRVRYNVVVGKLGTGCGGWWGLVALSIGSLCERHKVIL